MRSIIPILAVALMLGCKRDQDATSNKPAEEATSTGKVITSKELKFEAWFPNTPKEDKAKDGKRFLLVKPETKSAYMVQCTPFNPAVPLTDTTTIDLYFVGAKAGLVQGPNKGGKRTVEEKYQFEGKYPAWKVDVSLPDERIFRVRLIHRGTHFYQVIVAGTKDFVDSADARKFVDSLKFTD